MRNRLNQMASNAIQEIARASDGAFLAYPHFLDCVIELNGAAYESAQANAQDNFFEAPSFAGTIPLYPLTIGAKEWLSEFAYKTITDPEQQHYAVGFAMASKGRNLIDDVAQPKDILREVEKFRKQLRPITFEAFVEAIEYHLPQEPSGLLCIECGQALPAQPSEDEPDRANWSPIVCMLQREYHQPKEYWLYEASEAEITAKIDDFVARSNAANEGTASIASENNFRRFRQTVKDIKAEVTGWKMMEAASGEEN